MTSTPPSTTAARSHLDHSHGQVQWTTPAGPQSAPASKELLNQSLYKARQFRVGNRYPRKRSWQGWYWFASTGAHVWHESMLERTALQRLDFTGAVVAIAAQPMQLTFPDGTRHVPDFLALLRTGRQLLVDVKPEDKLERAAAQFEATRTLAAHVGWQYRVMSELPMAAKRNLEYLAAFRHPRIRPTDVAVAGLLAQLPSPCTVAEAAALLGDGSVPIGKPALHHLLWARVLTCDLTVPLSNATLVEQGADR